MTKSDFAAVNEPALRLGPLFQEMAPTGHDVAVLWSFTEIGLRQKEVAAREAKEKTGEQIKLMIASLPENTAIGKDGTELEISAYSVGGNYKEQVVAVHQALSRAGYPAHIVHERILPRGVLKNYRTLVIVGQTHKLPADAMKAIDDFTGRGGRIVVDRTTTVAFKDPVVTEANFKDPAYRWTPLYLAAEGKKFKTTKEGSYFQSNHFMDGLIREAVPATKAAMQKTDSKPIFASDSIHLAGERHLGGDGALWMVINGHEKLPEIADNQKYPIYNYAPFTATFTLQGIKPGGAVYEIAGNDWKKVRKLEDAAAPLTAGFEPGEMKLYLVAPRAPREIKLEARAEKGELKVTARLDNLKMPWPVILTVKDAEGKELYRVYRSMDKEGRFTGAFPIGSNAKPGAYEVAMESPAGNLSAQAKAEFKPSVPEPAVVKDAARVFDADAIASFLAGKPTLTVAFGSPEHKPIAEKLAKDLSARGIAASAVDEKQIVKRARYPRVWNPYVRIVRPVGDEKLPDGAKVESKVTIETADDGRTVAVGADNKDVGLNWRKPKTLADVGGKGFIDYNAPDGEQMYEPGCKVYVNDQAQLAIVKGKLEQARATDEFCAKWSRPWHRLDSYVGAFNLVPQLPEAYSADSHLVLLGDSAKSELVAALQASELLLQVADEKYPGAGKALVSFAWSPFALEKNVVLIGATDEAGLKAGAEKLMALLRKS